MSSTATRHHDVVIIGGGSAGVSVAARLRAAKIADVAVIEPADTHYYQPLWTLAGAGQVPTSASARPMASLMPEGVTWIRGAVTEADPVNDSLTLADGSTVSYTWLVVAAGIQLDWEGVDGLADTLGANGVSSNYRVDLPSRTWEFIRTLRSGTAVFSMPAGPIKCAGAPQKIAYLACDHWKREGVLDDIDVHLVLPTPGMFGIAEIAATLRDVVSRYGIQVHHQSEVVAIDGPGHTVTIRDNAAGATQTMHFDMAHIVPPQSAPDWIKRSALADAEHPGRYVKVDKHTLRHTDFGNVFALGDCTTTPNSKTGAAVRKQVPVLVANLLAARRSAPPAKRYDGYASCPVVTAHDKCVMVEFDYDLNLRPTFPLIDQTKERRDMYLVKRYVLPQLYWRLMLKGRA